MKITVKETIPEVPDFRKVDAGEWQAEPATIQLPGRQRRECQGFDLRRRIPGYGWVSAAMSQQTWNYNVGNGNIIINKEEDNMSANLPAVINFDETAMPIERLKGQINLIQQVMRETMKDGEHFGVIPGCGKKPSLLKPGAEKLSTVFRLAPSYDIKRGDLANGHREYEITCKLTHISTGQVVGEGVGSCSTMEAKYRYRTGEVTPTGKPVPKEYWDNRDQKIIGGKGYSTKKVDGKWQIVEQGERVEHDNPADHYNTVLKMAKKRAHVDAVLTATAASDIFTQDVEDMHGNGAVEGSASDDGLRGAEPSSPREEPPQRQPQPAQTPAGNGGTSRPATDKQMAAITKMATAKFKTDAAGFVAFVLANSKRDAWDMTLASDCISKFDDWAALFADSQRAA